MLYKKKVELDDTMFTSIEVHKTSRHVILTGYDGEDESVLYLDENNVRDLMSGLSRSLEALKLYDEIHNNL